MTEDTSPATVVEDVAEVGEEAIQVTADAAADAIARLESVIAALEQRIGEMADLLTNHNHEHQYPRGMRQLLDSFDELDRTDVSPVKAHAMYKPLFRRGGD